MAILNGRRMVLLYQGLDAFCSEHGQFAYRGATWGADRDRLTELDLTTFVDRVGCRRLGGGATADNAEGREKETGTGVLSPPKLVSRILRGEYVDMAELLKDTWRPRGRRQTVLEVEELRGRGSRRETHSDLLSCWLQCFSLSAAEVGSKYPDNGDHKQSTCSEADMARENGR